ncbi:hypothetical protein MN116_003669 [Schistosoma mekongi]|uniref:Thioredoxin domain-containing protein n=1 Tax=Schistosoma mekongi TaxID=38744 RepID=A0AAE1ZEI1_SCHME|nr:hypothetical protein MN116_003669 [Schistosoma mekongi]
MIISIRCSKFLSVSSKISLRSFLPIRNMSIFISEDKIRYLQWGVFFGFTGIITGCAVYMTRDLKKAKEVSKQQYGHPSIGGDFNLIDHNGKPCTLADFRGKWVLLYFGFCRCPDICPEQLERLVEVTDRIMLIEKPKYPLVPVFMTVDSERDTPEVLSQYIKEFSPHLIGLTGTKEEIDKAAKLYRIYYSASPKDADGDYIVDHTVVMYLLDPKGQFCDYYGQVKPVQEIVRNIVDKMDAYRD